MQKFLIKSLKNTTNYKNRTQQFAQLDFFPRFAHSENKLALRWKKKTFNSLKHNLLQEHQKINLVQMLEDLFHTILPYDINKIGSIASIFGTLISIVTVIYARIINLEVRKIRGQHLFLARIPEHLENLNESLKRMNEYMMNFETSHNLIKNELGLCLSEIQGIKEKMDNKILINKIIKLQKAIKLRKQKTFFKNKKRDQPGFKEVILQRVKRFYLTSSEDIWDIYSELNEIYQEVNNINLDIKGSLK